MPQVEPEKKKQHQQPKMTADQKREAARKRALEDPEDEHADKKPKVQQPLWCNSPCGPLPLWSPCDIVSSSVHHWYNVLLTAS